MTAPISEAFASTLRSDSAAALAALMIVSSAHRKLMVWAARMVTVEPLQEAQMLSFTIRRT